MDSGFATEETFPPDAKNLAKDSCVYKTQISCMLLNICKKFMEMDLVLQICNRFASMD